METTKNQLHSLFSYLVALVRNPIQEIQRLPNIEWKTLLIFQFCLSFTSVILSNLLAPFSISIAHVIVSLVASWVAISLASLFFYYFFLTLYERKLPFIKIFSLVLFAHIPFAIFHLAAYFFPPADLIGIGISALLMIVGLVENFQIPKKLATQLMILCYSFFLVYWVYQLITINQLSRQSSPQSLDQIEKELESTP